MAKPSKALIRKADKAMDALRDIMACNGTQNLQFWAQEEYTKQYLFTAFDSLKAFRDNIDNHYKG